MNKETFEKMRQALESEGYIILKQDMLALGDDILKSNSTKEQIDLLSYISQSLGTRIKIDYCLNGILVTFNEVKTLYASLNEAFISLVEPLVSEEPTPEIENCIKMISALAEKGGLEYTISRAVIKCLDTGVVETFYARHNMGMRGIFRLECVREFVADNPSSSYEVSYDLFKLHLNKIKVLNMDSLVKLIEDNNIATDSTAQYVDIGDMKYRIVHHYSDTLKRYDSIIGICTFVGGNNDETFSYSV